MDTEYDAPPVRIDGDRNAVQIKVSHDLGDRTLIVVILLTLVIGTCGVIMGLNLSKQAALDKALAEQTQEARMVQYYLNEVDGKLIHAGFIEPRDRWSPGKRKQLEEKAK